MLEREETFHRTLGVSSDIVQKEMYAFKDQGKNSVVLRPEGTASCMRWLTNESDLINTIEKEPVKLWYHGPMFRYERPQAGRLRQFHQLGVEHIGGSHNLKQGPIDYGHMIQTDYENIEAAVQCLDSIFEHKLSFKILLNNLGSKTTIKDYNDTVLEFLKANAQLLSEDSQKRIEQGNALRVLDSKDEEDQNFIDDHLFRGSMPSIDQFIGGEQQDAFQELIDLLKEL